MFLWLFLKIVFTRSLIEIEWFFYRSIWPMDGTLILSTCVGQIRPSSNDNEGLINASEQEPHHQMFFSFVPKTPFCGA